MFVVMCTYKELETNISDFGVKIVSMENSSYPMGFYDSEDEAIDWCSELNKVLNGQDKITTHFDVYEVACNIKPPFFEEYAKVRAEEADRNDESLKSLMDKGHIDQLIGEDGEFYYKLTDKGKEIAKKLRKFGEIDPESLDN